MLSITNGAAVINLQADEPFISPTDIEQLSDALQKEPRWSVAVIA